MNRTLVSRDGTPISRLAFGAMQFGGTASEKDAGAMFEACRAAGITHFDSAHAYTEGTSEEMLGRLAAPERDRLIIATKAGYTGGASARTLTAQFDLSRRRLGMDHVDILYLHRFDPDTDLAETMDCFAELKQRGLISYVGLSNFAAWQVMKAQGVARERGLTIDVLQPMYNLVKRQAEVELLPMAADQDILVAPYSPLGGGLLTGKYRGSFQAASSDGRLATDSRYAARYGPGWMREAAMGLGQIAAEIGVHAATLAVAWAARHATGPTPIISARNVAQLAPSLATLNFEMSDTLYARIAALSPTPPPATDRIEEV